MRLIVIEIEECGVGSRVWNASVVYKHVNPHVLDLNSSSTLFCFMASK
jgi:hypothetical protein